MVTMRMFHKEVDYVYCANWHGIAYTQVIEGGSE